MKWLGTVGLLENQVHRIRLRTIDIENDIVYLCSHMNVVGYLGQRGRECTRRKFGTVRAWLGLIHAQETSRPRLRRAAALARGWAWWTYWCRFVPIRYICRQVEKIPAGGINTSIRVFTCCKISNLNWFNGRSCNSRSPYQHDTTKRRIMMHFWNMRW